MDDNTTKYLKAMVILAAAIIGFMYGYMTTDQFATGSYRLGRAIGVAFWPTLIAAIFTRYVWKSPQR